MRQLDEVRKLSEDHRQLASFYGVETIAELVDEQAKHIEKLQARLPEYRDPFPRSPRR
jgi:hypothetical protein